MKTKIVTIIAALAVALVPIAGVYAADFYPSVSPDTSAKVDMKAAGMTADVVTFYPSVSPNTSPKVEAATGTATVCIACAQNPSVSPRM